MEAVGTRGERPVLVRLRGVTPPSRVTPFRVNSSQRGTVGRLPLSPHGHPITGTGTLAHGPAVSAKLTPDVTAARARQAADLGWRVLVVQLRGGVGSEVDPDVQSEHLSAAAAEGWTPVSIAAAYDSLGAQHVTVLLVRSS